MTKQLRLNYTTALESHDYPQSIDSGTSSLKIYGAATPFQNLLKCNNKILPPGLNQYFVLRLKARCPNNNQTLLILSFQFTMVHNTRRDIRATRARSHAHKAN